MWPLTNKNYWQSVKALLLMWRCFFSFMASIELQKAVQGYENYILTNGIDEDVIFAMIEAAKTAILTEKDEKYGLEVSKRAKELVNEYVINLTGGNIYDLDSYCNINKTNYEILNTWYEVLKLEAGFAMQVTKQQENQKQLNQDRHYPPQPL